MSIAASTPVEQANARLLAQKGWLVSSWAGFVPMGGSGFGPSQREALTMSANFESFGAQVAPESARLFSWQPLGVLERAYFLIETALRKASGAHRDFEPMYPNFPQQVERASDASLLSNAAAHYGSVASGGRALPESERSERSFEALPDLGLRFEIIDEAAALAHLGALARSNTSMGPEDSLTMRALAQAFAALGRADEAASALSGGSNKENLAACAVAARDIGALDRFAGALSVCADALRVACALSGGDASLASPTKFIPFSRPARRTLLGVIERHLEHGDAEQALENLFSRKQAWTRLGERLHPGEFSKHFPLTAIAFSDLRSNKPPRPYADKIKEAFGSKDAAASIALLRTRPGEFCRRAGAAARALGPSAHGALAQAFDGCAHSVSTPALLQALSAFENAASAQGAAASSRAFMPKGGMGKIYLRGPQEGSALDSKFAASMAESCQRALAERFSSFAPLGNVYVDPALDKIHVPFASRSASRQTKTLARGSRLGVQGSIARLFTWWSESGAAADGTALSCSRVDIDLSCLFLGADFKPMGHVSWTHLRDQKGAVLHSGDVTSAPRGACEFIDVDYAKLDPKIKYVAMTIHSFTGQNFSDMPECFAGWMGRDQPMAGKLFDARAVAGKSDVAMAASTAMPMFLDIDAREAVWADLALAKTSGYSMVEAQSKTIAMAVEGLARLKKPTLGALARLHARARGVLVDSPEQADVVFSLTQGVTPYDTELIGSELMADAPPERPKIKKPEPAASLDQGLAEAGSAPVAPKKRPRSKK